MTGKSEISINLTLSLMGLGLSVKNVLLTILF